MEFREHTLANGLEVIAECNPQAYSTALGFFVKTGSRDETDANHGVSHFLEHMVFKGTARRSAADVNRELDEIGSHSNAFTSEEQTAYFAAFLPEYQDRAVELLSDILRPALREDDFEMEKKVILEEIAKYEDQPPFGAHEKCMAAYFGDHPLGNSVLGTTDSITRLTSTQMREYFERRYSPNNLKLVAAGRVDFDALVQKAIACCGDWPAYPAERPLKPASLREGFQAFTKESASQQYIVQITAGPAADDPDRYASRLLATILGDDSGSRLYWELVDPGLAEFAGIGTYEFQGTGIFMSYLCCAPEQAAENLERIRHVELEVERQGITASELELACNKICSQLVRQSERPSNRMFSLGNGWLQRHIYQTVQERLAAYQRVTLPMVHAALERYSLSRNTTVSIGPLATD